MHTGFLYSSCFSYAIRSQSVLTTIQLGVSTVFSAAAPGSETFPRLVPRKLREPSRHVRC